MCSESEVMDRMQRVSFPETNFSTSVKFSSDDFHFRRILVCWLVQLVVTGKKELISDDRPGFVLTMRALLDFLTGTFFRIV